MNQNQNRDEIRAKDLWRAKNGMPQDNGNNKTPGGRKKPPRSLLVFGSILAGLLLLGILLKITGFSSYLHFYGENKKYAFLRRKKVCTFVEKTKSTHFRGEFSK